MNEIEARVNILERDVDELRELRPLIYAMDKKLDLLTIRKECPNPGLCQALEPRVSSLEVTRSKLSVVVMLVGAFGSVLGGIVVGVVVKLF